MALLPVDVAVNTFCAQTSLCSVVCFECCRLRLNKEHLVLLSWLMVLTCE